MFSYQNRRGLNRPILRPLWLMTSAAADVISVPSVYIYTWYSWHKLLHPCGHNPATHHQVVHNPAAHHRVAGLCAAWWCTAGLCVGRLVYIEGRPWISNNLLKKCSCRDVNHQRYFTACAVLISAYAQSQAIVSMYKCYHIVNRFLRNKSEWHVTQNTHISIRH